MVRRLALQSVRRDLPRRSSAEVGEEDRKEADAQRGRHGQRGVADAEGEDADRNRPVLRFIAPGDRAHQEA